VLPVAVSVAVAVRIDPAASGGAMGSEKEASPFASVVIWNECT
jgi:hypothetical protein